MPSLLLEDVPADVYERLQVRAKSKLVSVSEVAVEWLSQFMEVQPAKSPRLPDYIPGEEIVAPVDLPRMSTPIRVRARLAQTPRMPDPPFIEERE